MDTEKLKVESLVSAEVRVSNADIASRNYDINAVVRVDNGTVGNVSQGQVKTKAAVENSMILASFDTWSPNNLNVQFQVSEDRPEILAEIESFVLKCRTDQSIVASAVTE